MQETILSFQFTSPCNCMPVVGKIISGFLLPDSTIQILQIPLLCSIVMLSVSMGTAADAQIKAQPPKGPVTPPWDKGIQAISRDSFYNAIACGKQGGANPPCVFWDTGLCKNPDFTLAIYTPYKQVAYEVWQAVQKKQEPPTPSYADAHYNLALAWERQGHKRRALRHWLMYVKLDPVGPWAHHAKAQAKKILSTERLAIVYRNSRPVKAT